MTTAPRSAAAGASTRGDRRRGHGGGGGSGTNVSERWRWHSAVAVRESDAMRVGTHGREWRAGKATAPPAATGAWQQQKGQ